MRRRFQKINDDERVITDPERSRERTMSRAVKLLAAKPRSIGELRERLLEKNWTNAEIVSRVLERLKEYSYLDDTKFASDLALSKLRQKPQGKRRLQQSLSQKKLSKEDVETALVSAFEKMPETELIDAVIAKRLRLKGKPPLPETNPGRTPQKKAPVIRLPEEALGPSAIFPAIRGLWNWQQLPGAVPTDPRVDICAHARGAGCGGHQVGRIPAAASLVRPHVRRVQRTPRLSGPASSKACQAAGRWALDCRRRNGLRRRFVTR